MASMTSSFQLGLQPAKPARSIRSAPRVVTVRNAASATFGNSYNPRLSWEEIVEAHWAQLGAAGEFLRGKAPTAKVAKRKPSLPELSVHTSNKPAEPAVVTQVFASRGDSLSDAIKKGGDKLEDAADSIAGGIRSGGDSVKDASRDAKGAGRDARGEVDSAAGDAKRAGNRLVDGVRGAADELGDGLRNVGDRLTGRTDADRAEDWLLQYKHVATVQGVLRAAAVALLLAQLAGVSTAFAGLIRWGEGVAGAAQLFSSASLSARAQLGMAAVCGALLASDVEAARNHAWSDVKGKVALELFFNAAVLVGGTIAIKAGRISPGFGIFVAAAAVFLAWNAYVWTKNN